MKIRTSELAGIALDWAVSRIIYPHLIWGDSIGHAPCKPPDCDTGTYRVTEPDCYFHPSTDWAQGGPIIERENITIIRCDDEYGTDAKGYSDNKRIPVWAASTGQYGTQSCYEGEHYEPQYEVSESDCIYGRTPLQAAMRCYCHIILGPEIEVPDEISKITSIQKQGPLSVEAQSPSISVNSGSPEQINAAIANAVTPGQLTALGRLATAPGPTEVSHEQEMD